MNYCIDETNPLSSQLHFNLGAQKPSFIICSNGQKPSIKDGEFWLQISETECYMRLNKKPNIIKTFLLKNILSLNLYKAVK